MNRITNFFDNNGKQMAAILAAFVILGVVMNSSLLEYQANLLAISKSDAFNGTALPVKMIPSWVDLSSSEWKMPYDQLPQSKFITLPKYDPAVLIVPTSTLNYSKTADKAVRNAQVTYSVPYMGNYQLDGKEYAGSHLAVDLKIPSGTPVYAIANGIVVKAANQSSGFGYHVVLRHDDVPSLGNENTKVTYYSGYAHLSSYSVVEGQKINKGQQIGFSGATGTATTPHLHFQIDNADAPWHPYWPFTSKEASDAGVSFWDAINTGLGKDKALATTISPMAFVQKYLAYNESNAEPTNSADNTNSTASNDNTNTSSTVNDVVTNNQNETPVHGASDSPTIDELPPTETVTTSSEPVNIASQPTVIVTPVAVPMASIDLEYEKNFKVGVDQTFKVKALDKDGKLITNFVPKQELYIKVENGSATLKKSYLNAQDFVNGIATFNITPTAEYGIRVSVRDNQVIAISEVLQAVSFTDVNEEDSEFVAINFLKSNEIVKGYSDGTFKPDSPVTRVEALKFIYEGLNKDVKPKVVLEFNDTDSKAWYARYIAAAQMEGVVQGYSGNIFKPGSSVTRAEFIKMLVQAAGYNGATYVSTTKNFDDVKKGDWYYSYVALAKDKNLLDTSSNKFRPNEAMTRGEVSQVLYKMILLEVSGKRTYDQSIVVNNDEVSNFYSQV